MPTPARPASLLALLLALVPCARAQDGRPDSDEVARRLAEMRRLNDELQRAAQENVWRAEAQLAYVGRVGPWPPADPDLGPPEAWRERLLAAPAATAGDVLARCEKVAVSARRAPDVSELLPDDELRYWLVRAAHGAGKETHPNSLLCLSVDLELAQGPVDGAADAERFHYVRIEAELVLPGRVLRTDGPHLARVTVAAHTLVDLGPDEVGAEQLGAAIEACVAALFEDARAGGPPADPEGWNAWLQSVSAADGQAAFRGSYVAEERLDPALAQLPGLGPVDVSLTGPAQPLASAAAEAGAVDVDAVRAAWVEFLQQSSLAAGTPHAPALRSELAWTATPLRTRDWLACCRSRTSVREDALVLVDGAPLRLAVESAHATRIRLAEPGELAGQLLDAVRASAQDLRAALLPPGQAPLPPHPDAEAVARFLRTRQRLELPPDALLAIANRIAHAFAEAPDIPASVRESWFVDVEGQRTCYLPYAGGARSASGVARPVRAAIDRVIDDLTRADPLGMWAFQDPWIPQDYSRIELPEGFARYFAGGARPSGPGALRSVRVLSAEEMVAKDLSYRDFRERPPLEAALRQVRERLGDAYDGARVLVCEYVPSDGNMSLSLTRRFWYRAAPPGWDGVRSGLPEELSLARVGPAREVAPDTLEQADAALAAVGIR